MGDNIPTTISYDHGNKYERQSCLHLNMDILDISDYSVLNTAKLQNQVLTAEQDSKMNSIISACSEKYESWGFKDPRTPLVLPCWGKRLPEHKVIAIFRHPGEIWPRFCWNGKKRFFKNPIMVWQFVKRWREHNIGIIDYIKSNNVDYLMLNYNEIVTSDSEFQRLEDFVGIKLDDQRDKSLYRSKNRDWKLLQIADSLIGMLENRYISDIMTELEDLRQSQL